MRYLGSLFEKLRNDLQGSVKIMDLVSSYGIISTLKLCDLTWSQLIDFYVEDNRLKRHLWGDIEKFYTDRLQDTDKYKFYLLDSSKPAIEFAKKMNLCEQGYAFDLKHDSLTDELKDIVPQIDILICVGSIGYIGPLFFQQMLPLVIAKSSLPLLGFSTYPTPCATFSNRRNLGSCENQTFRS
ncbi:MAG: hypothetical protein QNJ74_29620 [Trichodesmium sp. MO_231.B1]|nr:hypothetical protein [Trichodesmium sp. MO_231.B1]